MPSLLEIGRRAAMQAEREAIERVLAQTKWNRRQAARILKVSYKALLNKLQADGREQQATCCARKSLKVEYVFHVAGYDCCPRRLQVTFPLKILFSNQRKQYI